MRLRTVLALIAAALVVAGIVWGLDGALLAFFYAIPVTVISTAAARASEPRGYVTLNVVLWLTTRPLALFVGYAWHGWVGAVAVLLVVLLLESLGFRARRRFSS